MWKEATMREILYRAISMCRGEHWVYGQPRHYARNPHTEKWTIYDPTTGIETDIVEETLGQYTGMIDKNGNKIFEDDILENHHLSEDVARHKVKFEVGMGCYVAILLIGPLAGFFFPFGQSWIENYDKVIVGNIHDNPDLLKGGAK